MNRLDEIEGRLQKMYLINPSDLGAYSNSPNMRMVEVDMQLLIRAVRQLGARLDEVEYVAQLDSEELERIEAEHPIDSNVLELLERENDQ